MMVMHRDLKRSHSCWVDGPAPDIDSVPTGPTPVPERKEGKCLTAAVSPLTASSPSAPL